WAAMKPSKKLCFVRRAWRYCLNVPSRRIWMQGGSRVCHSLICNAIEISMLLPMIEACSPRLPGCFFTFLIHKTPISPAKVRPEGFLEESRRWVRFPYAPARGHQLHILADPHCSR